MRRLFVSLLLSSVLCIPAFAADEPTAAEIAEKEAAVGTVTLKGGSVAAGVGYTWGHGDLEYHGEVHRFTIRGVSVVDAGADKFTAKGQVYHLRHLEDFTGNYVAAGAGVVIAGGATATYLKNEHGVVIKLIETDIGLKFNLSADGVHIALKK